MAFRSLGPFGKLVVVGTGALAVGALLQYRLIPFHIDFYKTLFDINETPKYISEHILADYKKLQEQESGNSLLKKYLTKDVFHRVYNVKTPRNATLKDLIQSGIENPDSEIGVYVPETGAYESFRPLLDPIIADLHGGIRRQPSSDWGQNKLDYFDKNLDSSGKYITKTRIECSRNMAGFSFHPLMRDDDYYLLESKFKSGFLKITDDADLKGNYISLKNVKIDDKELIKKENLVFANDDKFLKSAKVYQFWPSGRALFYCNRDGNTLTGYVGGEDHLKLVSAAPGADIKTAFDRLGRCVRKLERQLKFAHSDRLGFLTYSPANLGSGVHATVEMKLPNMSAQKDFQETCEKLNLKCKAGDRGVFLVSNKQTLGVSEYDSVKQLYDGVRKLVEMEEGGGGSS